MSTRLDFKPRKVLPVQSDIPEDVSEFGDESSLGTDDDLIPAASFQLALLVEIICMISPEVCDADGVVTSLFLYFSTCIVFCVR